MAKELTLPTPPAAPTTPRVGINERIQGIENRIQEIEGIGNTHQKTNANQNSRPQYADEEQSEESNEEEQAQTAQTQQKSSRPQNQTQTQQRQPSSRTVTTPEDMARDAVANGSGALTKRTTTRKSDENPADTDRGTSAKNPTTIVIPPDSSLNDNGQTKFERGRAVIKEFQQLDKENSSKSQNTQTSTSTPSLFKPSNVDSSQHGIIYWLFTFVAVGILAFVFINQFLLKKSKKPLSKSDINQSLNDIANSATPKPQVNPSIKTVMPKPAVKSTVVAKESIKIQPVKPVVKKSKPKTEDDNKGKHFEVRV